MKDLKCPKCDKITEHIMIRKFKYDKGYKYWYSCTECNNIQVIK